jgi:hypothetical protein
MYERNHVHFIEIDYDTEDIIKKHNKDDADFNGIPLEMIYEMIK